MKRKAPLNKTKNSKLTQKRPNQMSIDGFLPSTQPSRPPVAGDEAEIKEEKKISEIKQIIINKELNYINKNVPLSEEKQQENIPPNFPLIVAVPLGISKALRIPQLKELLDQKYPSRKLISLQGLNHVCIDLELQDTVIGYISKNISEAIKLIFSNELYKILFFLHTEKLEVIIIIEVNYFSYDLKIKKENYLYTIIPSQDKKEIAAKINSETKKVFKYSLNYLSLKDEREKQRIELVLNEISLQKDEKRNEINNNELSESLDITTLEENEEKSLLTDFLIVNADKIINMVRHFSFLFDDTWEKIPSNYFNLSKSEKEILINFITRSSKWVNISKIENNSESMEKVAEKFVQMGFLAGFDSVFNFSAKSIDYNLLFEFLYYLKVDELREIYYTLSNAKAQKNTTKKSPFLVSSQVNDIFINNPFNFLCNYISNKELKCKAKAVSQYLTSIIFDKDYFAQQARSEKAMNNFANHFNKAISQKKYNSSYVSENLNPTGFKKVHFLKAIMTAKISLISSIIDSIHLMFNNKSSSLMEQFLQKSDGFLLDSKKSLLDKAFEKHKKRFFCLDFEFAKMFDISTRLFFFYTDYRDINSVAKEFYGIDSFEHFHNYINDKNNVEYQSYLKPIFNEKNRFELFDSLYQIKNAFVITSMSLYLSKSNEILYNVINEFFPLLLKFSNESLLQQLEIEHTDGTEEEYTKRNEKLIDIIVKKYESNPAPLKDTFLKKYHYSFVANQILTYYAELCEKNKMYHRANFVYYFLILSDNLIKKRGNWWYRAILNNISHIKSRANAVKLLNSVKFDIKINKTIKTGYLLKIKNYYEKLIDQKSKKKNIIPLQNLKPDIFSEEGDNSQEVRKEQKFDIQTIFKTIKNDSIFSEFSGRRLYAISDNSISSVETFAIDYYAQTSGYVGIHGENEVIPTLFNILLWDCIFYDKVEYVFQTPYQSYPLDLFYSDFYKSRKELLEKRFLEIEGFSTDDVIQEIERIYNDKKGIKSVFVNWKSFRVTKEILIDILIAITPKKIVSIFKEIVGKLKYVVTGMPDLFLWKNEVGKEATRPSRKAKWDSLKMVEVKSTNDKLSEHQKFWLELLHRCGVDVEVLHIV